MFTDGNEIFTLEIASLGLGLVPEQVKMEGFYLTLLFLGQTLRLIHNTNY